MIHCPRCGDLLTSPVTLWNGQDLCRACCVRCGGEAFADRMTAGGAIVVNELRRMPRKGWLVALVTVFVCCVVLFALPLGALLAALIALPVGVYLIYLSGLERVRFDQEGILVEAPLGGSRRHHDIELVSWYVYDPEGTRKRLSSDSFVRFRVPGRRRPITQRLWGDLDGLRDLRGTLLLIAPEKEVLTTLGQLFPALA